MRRLLTVLDNDPAGFPVFTRAGQDTVINAKGGATRRISRMTMWAGKLFLGYGSNNETARPLPTRYYDPVARTFNTLGSSMDTDSYYAHWTHNDNLYQLCVDPAGHAPDQDYSKVTSALAISYSTVDPPYTEHAYHMATHSDSALYMAGERYDGSQLATVWKSTNDGATWTVAYTSPTALYYWYINIFHLNGYLWVQAYDPVGPGIKGNTFRSLDGVTWSDSGIRMTGVYAPGRAVVFNGYAFIRQGLPESNGGKFYRFDGLVDGVDLQSSWFGYPCVDVCTDNGYLYVLLSGSFGHKIMRSIDGVNFNLFGVPSNPITGAGTAYTSIEVYNGTIYLADTQANLYYADIPNYTIPADFVTDAGGRQIVDLDGRFVTNG